MVIGANTDYYLSGDLPNVKICHFDDVTSSTLPLCIKLCGFFWQKGQAERQGPWTSCSVIQVKELSIALGDIADMEEDEAILSVWTNMDVPLDLYEAVPVSSPHDSFVGAMCPWNCCPSSLHWNFVLSEVSEETIIHVTGRRSNRPVVYMHLY